MIAPLQQHLSTDGVPSSQQRPVPLQLFYSQIILQTPRHQIASRTIQECKLIAPKDPEYCQSSCSDYCSQTDRKDGLSGSISSENGETGILGTTTVVKGEDKPPQLKIPGLDFTSDKGKKLLGY
mmetsp:Transcript_29092/g.49613  ORF Transcript_29092/g.49613 Transcript_29092/m.49613 type:complete len:124 (-) Transcript_29092:130-501(-)